MYQVCIYDSIYVGNINLFKGYWHLMYVVSFWVRANRWSCYTTDHMSMCYIKHNIIIIFWHKNTKVCSHTAYTISVWLKYIFICILCPRTYCTLIPVLKHYAFIWFSKSYLHSWICIELISTCHSKYTFCIVTINLECVMCWVF